MSANKMKYFYVTTESVVTANNKTDASAIARGRRGVPGKRLDSWESVERISAAEAKGEVEATA